MAGLLGMIERNMHLSTMSTNDRGGGDSLPFLFPPFEFPDHDVQQIKEVN